MSWQKVIQNLNELNQKMELLLPKMEQLSFPPEHTLLDDVQLREKLKMSKRTTAYLREKGLITYSKIGSKIFYRFSDVLLFLKHYEVPAVNTSSKINFHEM